MQMERVRKIILAVRQAQRTGPGATPEALQADGFRPDEISQAVAEGHLSDYVTMGPALVYILTPQAELLAYRLGWQ